MAKRPSPRSDAQVREQYRRRTRRSARAQEIAEDLERTGIGETLAISRWNRGEDPALQAVSDANAAVAARGFSAAAADRGRAMQAVDRAMQAEPDSNLPPVGKAMFERAQNRLPGNAEEFLRDADEYSGRRAGNYNVGGRKPNAAPAEPEPEATGTISTTRKSYLDELAGTAGTKSYNAGDLARQYQEEQFERARLLDRLGQEGRNRWAKVEQDQLSAQLREKGISPELAGTEGTSTGFDANKARGMLAQATFQGWEDDKALEQRAEKLEQAEKRRLRTLRRYEDVMGGRLTPEATKSLADSIFEAETNIAEGNKNRGGLNRTSYWRQQAEDLDRAQTAEQTADDNIVKANNATAASLRENQTNLTKMLTKLFEEFERGEFSADRLSQINAFIAAMGGAK